MLLATIVPHLKVPARAYPLCILTPFGRAGGQVRKTTACDSWSNQPPSRVVIGQAMIVVNDTI
jgi:hypothetical protein